MLCPDCGQMLICRRTTPKKRKTARIRVCAGCKAKFLTVEKVLSRIRK
jgi:transcriptional regulator NrdR family protein